MNVYCVKCGSEMEIMRDLGSELRVYPCGCAGKDKQKRKPIKKVIMSHVQKVTILFVLIFSLACGVNTQLPYSQNTPESVNTAAPTESAQMVVSGLYPDEPLNIRAGAGGAEIGQYLYNGDVVVLYQSVTRGDTLWCAIDAMYTRWVACRYLKAERN